MCGLSAAHSGGFRFGVPGAPDSPRMARAMWYPRTNIFQLRANPSGLIDDPLSRSPQPRPEGFRICYLIEDHMPGYVPTVAEIEAALKQLHNPEALRASPLATLDLVHERVAPARRAPDHTTAPLPWIYGYELAALLRERIDNLLQDAETPHEQPAN